jgi:hypothetical protein
MENWADFASLTLGTDGTWWAQWFQNRPEDAGGGYSGWISRSSDQGTTWTTPAPLGHEFVALAPLSDGRMLSVWLESLHAGGGHAHHDHAEPGTPSMKLCSRLLGPDGATLGEWTVDPDVCTCCQTTLTSLGDDRVFVAYRGHTKDEIRDNRRALFSGTSWGAPQVLNADHWQIAGCPVNGPASAAKAGALAVAWFTAARDEARVYAKYSNDAGETFSAPLRIDNGQPMGRIDVAMLSDASAVVVWMENHDDEKTAGIYARRIFADGKLTPAQQIANSSQARASGFPRITARANDSLLLTWTEESTPTRVRVMEFAPPAESGAKGMWSAPSSLTTTKPVAGKPSEPVLKGVIVDVLPDQKALLVKHQEVPGVMKAMTMMLRVDDAALKSATKGRAVTGQLIRRGAVWWLDDVQLVTKE